MDRLEIVAYRPNEELLFRSYREKWPLGLEMAKMFKEAASQFTFRRPLSCPKKGEKVIYAFMKRNKY